VEELPLVQLVGGGGQADVQDQKGERDREDTVAVRSAGDQAGRMNRLNFGSVSQAAR